MNLIRRKCHKKYYCTINLLFNLYYLRQIKKEIEEENQLQKEAESEIIIDAVEIEETVKNTLFNKFVGKITQDYETKETKDK